MKYSVEVLKYGSDPTLNLEEKAKRVVEIVEKAVFELETYLFFIEDVLKEVVERVV